MSSFNSLHRCKPLLGTYVDVSLQGDASDIELIAQSEHAFKVIESVQTALSFHDSNSELSLLNRSPVGVPFKISSLMQTVLEQTNQLHNMSGGLFDPSVASELMMRDQLPQRSASPLPGRWTDLQLGDDFVVKHKPMMLDLGGIAKGFAVDKAIERIKLRSNSDANATVNAGGDLRMTHWQNQAISIRHGVEPGLKTVAMQAPAVATSASYLTHNESVIIDPTTSTSVDAKSAVSVFASSCMMADALTKLALLGAHDCLTSLDAVALFS